MNSPGRPKDQPGNQFKPDDHSEVVPLLPIPNRTVKRLSANDSAGSRVKVGHRQATIEKAAVIESTAAFFCLVCRAVISTGGSRVLLTPKLPARPGSLK